MTPIMWNVEILSPTLQFVIKLNPLFYIVRGYREALYDKIWFFENWQMTIYFWIFVIFVFAIGAVIFKRLKIHFADVL